MLLLQWQVFPGHKCKQKQLYILNWEEEEEKEKDKMDKRKEENSPESDVELSFHRIIALASIVVHYWMKIKWVVKMRQIATQLIVATHIYLDINVANQNGCIV